MVEINFENDKPIRVTNGKINVYNYGEGIPHAYFAKIINALGQEKCTLDTVLSIFINCDFVSLDDFIGVFKNSDLLVVIEWEE